MKSGITSLILTGVLASASFATFAQTALPETAHAPAVAASSAKHMAGLKAKLKLTADQESAWTVFTTANRPPAPMEHLSPDRADLAKLSTPERIDKMRALRSQHMTERTSAMDKRDEATKAFYVALNADQKKTFDTEHARIGRHHGPNRGKAAEQPSAK